MKNRGKFIRRHAKLSCPSNFNEILKNSEKFNFKNNYWGGNSPYISFLVSKYKNEIKDLILNDKNNDQILSIFPFSLILFLYGTEFGEKIIDKLSQSSSGKIAYKRRSKLQKELNEFKNGLNQKLNKGFSFKYGIYFCEYSFNLIDESVYFLKIFFDFNDFAVYINGDFSNANLEYASIEGNEIFKYKFNKDTKFPWPREPSKYTIRKFFNGEKFIVEERWYNKADIEIEFNNFETCDVQSFISYLNGDLSNADLIMFEDAYKLRKINYLNLENALFLDELIENIFKNDEHLNNKLNYEISKINEVQSRANYSLINQSFDYSFNKFAYISDLHLPEHLCKLSLESKTKFINEAIKKLVTTQESINFIAGDISNNFSLYELFLKLMKKSHCNSKLFITLGNHELWTFPNFSVKEKIEKFRDLIKKYDFHLLHNNLFYFDSNDYFSKHPIEIDENNLFDLSLDELKNVLKYANIVIFGGIGFSAFNPNFNANNGIYQNEMTFEEEMVETQKFNDLYEKVIGATKGKMLFVVTHMPFSSWSRNNISHENVIYISGHDHKNYYINENGIQVFADNQVGYENEVNGFKSYDFSREVDLFYGLKEGIYNIKKEDYMMFWCAKRKPITANRELDTIHLIKKNGLYMFISENKKKNLFLLDGGRKIKLPKYNLNYFYENLDKLVNTINLYLSKYYDDQKLISIFVKSFGGSGRIHGTIIDIDFYNHIYFNPLDYKLTPYYATDIIDKHIYHNLISLIADKAPELLERYKAIISKEEYFNGIFPVITDNKIVTKNSTFYEDTDIYKISNLILKFQHAYNFKVLRYWNDELIDEYKKEDPKTFLLSFLDD